MDEKHSLIFDSVYRNLVTNKKLKEEGKDLVIPCPFSRLSKEWPGIQQGKYYLISSTQKVGKTQITDFVFVFNPINFVLDNETNIKLKIFDFNLEMNKEAKYKQLMVHRYYLKTGNILNVRQLESIYKDYILPDEVLRFIEKERDWFEKFENIVEYIDDIRNVFGIYKRVKNFFESNGRYEYKTITITEDNKTKEIKVIDRYIPNDPNLFVIIKVDNINLITPERGSTLYEDIGKFSSEYMVHARNRWNAIPVIIQQQALQKEGNDSIRMGRTRPSADGLADNKSTSKDCDVFMGIYSPYRVGERSYLNYDITKLKDHYRNFYIDFDRNGNSCETSLYFHGAVNYFRELPSASKLTPEMYNNIHNLAKPKQNF